MGGDGDKKMKGVKSGRCIELGVIGHFVGVDGPLRQEPQPQSTNPGLPYVLLRLRKKKKKMGAETKWMTSR